MLDLYRECLDDENLVYEFDPIMSNFSIISSCGFVTKKIFKNVEKNNFEDAMRSKAVSKLNTRT